MDNTRDTQHILVIDDDPMMVQMYRAILSGIGHQVDSAEHPDEAIHKLQQQEQAKAPYTVAVIDMLFEHSGVMGKELARRIKQDFPHIATVIATSLTHNPQNILELRDESGVDQFIQKRDIDPDKAYVLQGIIRRAVERVQAQIKSAQIAHNKIMVDPVFGAPNSSERFKCDVFMIMPFRDEYWRIYDKAIVPATRNKQYKIIHGADMFTTKHVMSDVWSGIYASKFVIADCTGQNANVFYELGMAHTLGKPAIPITQNTEDIPFDTRSYRYIKYTTTPEGLVKLRVDLEDAIDGLVADLGLR